MASKAGDKRGGAGGPETPAPGKMTLIIGPMFAGKTTELQRRVETYTRCGQRCLLIRHTADVRGEPTEPIYTHRGVGLDTTMLPYIRFVRANRLDDEAIPPGDEGLIAVDEGHFFTDIASACRGWTKSGRNVVVSALSGRSDRKPWKEVGDLIPEADEIVLLKAVCTRCRRPERSAGFSVRTREAGEIETDDGIAVGGAEAYEAVCRGCADEHARA